MSGQESGTWVGGIATAVAISAVFETVVRHAADLAPFVVGGNGTMHGARMSVGPRGSSEGSDSAVLGSGAATPHAAAAILTEVTA